MLNVIGRELDIRRDLVCFLVGLLMWRKAYGDE
jgi:hypothetical protein